MKAEQESKGPCKLSERGVELYLFLMVVAECRLRGRGAVPERAGLLHMRVSAARSQHKPIKRLQNHPSLHQQRAPTLTYVEDPQVSQATAAHAPVDDEPGSSGARHHSRVALPRRGRLPRRRGDFPAHDAGAWPQLQAVEVVQIPGTQRRWLRVRACPPRSGTVASRALEVTTWGCCSWGPRCRWPILQTGNRSCRSERSCVRGGGKGAGRSWEL